MARTKTGLLARLVLAFALLAPGVLAGEVVPASKQFEIQPPRPRRPYADGRHDHVAATVTSLGSQGFAVGWETAYNADYGNYFTAGQRFLADGSPAESFTPTTWIDWWGWVGNLSFARLGEGRFVSVACTSAELDYNVWFRRFEAGQPPPDPESVLLYGFASTQSDVEPRIASDGDGLFVIAWRRFHYDSPYGMKYENQTSQEMAQVFGPDGQPVSPEIAVTEPVPSQCCETTQSVVGMDADGNFVVLWTDFSTPLYLIWGQRFDRTGSPLGDRFRIGNQQGTGRVAMVMAPSGEFIAAWRAPINPELMRLSRFTADGRRMGSVAWLSYDGGDPAIALDRSGRVALFWIDGRRRPALAVFDASLNRLGPVVFDPPASRGVFAPWEDTRRVGVAFGDNGRIFTVWVGPRGRGVRDSILGRFWRVR